MIFLAMAGAIILGLIPAVIASQKGYSLRLWWAFGALLFPVTLPMALLLPTTEKALKKTGAGSCPGTGLPRVPVLPR